VGALIRRNTVLIFIDVQADKKNLITLLLDFKIHFTLISNNCPGKQTRFLSTLKNLAAACFSFSSANLITFNLKKNYICV
jgi:hypothetical protein